ncbi:MAG: AAA family ATPase [Halieaceae bacterium]|jgi:type II secretory pathway predicted ATPase ExeA|nr:AAA family ATPase [Halieaceae bacterium]
MYEEFYGLTERPFLTVPDPDFLYWGEGHTLAFTMLRYGLLTRAPITVITGEIGSGKTTLLRQLMREIPGDLEVILISNMQTNRGELLHWIFMSIDRNPADKPYVQLFKEFQEYLIQSYAEGKRVAIIFDEAQNIGIDSIEEIRMLTNINADKDELLQIVLVGQPQLRAMLGRPELRQFSQRISADFHLGPLGEDDVEKYIHHRLAKAGAKWNIFTNKTCKLVQKATGGVPRLVNVLCDLCLVYGFSSGSKVVDETLLREFLDSAKRRGIYEQFRPLDDTPKLVRQTR